MKSGFFLKRNKGIGNFSKKNSLLKNLFLHKPAQNLRNVGTITILNNRKKSPIRRNL